MSTFFSLASGGSVVLLCSVSLSSQSDLTIDNFALATGTLVLLFLGGQTLMLCEMGAWRSLCADLGLPEKFIYCDCVRRSELMFICRCARLHGGQNCLFALSSEADLAVVGSVTDSGQCISNHKQA